LTATSAIIPASGLGKRLGRGTGKAFVPLLGRPLVVFTLSPFEISPAVNEIILVAGEQDIPQARQIIRDYDFRKVGDIVPGGPERQDSVRNGLRAVSPGMEIIAIHDGARPTVTPRIIEDSIRAAQKTGAAIAAMPVIDTIKASDGGRIVESTLDRSRLYSVQTPQTFKREVIEAAYERAYSDGFYGTDDACLVERMGLPVTLVEGSYENIKVTTPTDLIIVEAILSQQDMQYAVRDTKSPPRVGYGYDVHRFAPGRRLFLGGVEFEGEEGLLGHSDADVLLHAVMDAVLGAAGLGDIGTLFPDTDPKYKDIRSTQLLAEVGNLITEKGWKVGNVDVTLLAERPRIASRVPEMCEIIAQGLRIGPNQVSTKASTSEGLGFVGRGEGIACHAVILLSLSSS
jgi:2-C-methyl-D-erythritol 4-phosphate cytidylyltransferase/2-C-methyl-D-erythritol 2,4-cyclodiphosphate synthase